MRRLVFIGALVVALMGAWGVARTYAPQEQSTPKPLAEWNISKRPRDDRFLYDYAKTLPHFEEGVHRYMERIAQDFFIEPVILTLQNVPPSQGIDRVATDVLNNWRIGADFEGRALLLVLVQDLREVRMEVSYELEDVFTDAFVGHVEDKQLEPYFLNNDIGTGLIALMEEIDRRAELKHQGEYTPELIARLDTEFISGGAGAKRDLKKYSHASGFVNELASSSKRGASTPEEAWRSMLAKWAGRGSNLNIEVYTELTKMAMGEPERPDPRTKSALPHWQNAPFRVLKENDHAVIYLGFKKGWDNAPFLFCRDRQGWKFDIVHQRRLVVMGAKQSWYVEQGRFPYVSLLREVPQSMGKDLPLSSQDLYRCSDDASIAGQINALTVQLEGAPDDYRAVRELLRLNVITGRRPNHVQPLIQRAKTLAPEDPLPYKYAAIYNVNTFFQYKTALKEIEAYLQRNGDLVFGYNFKGFLHYRLRQYDQAVTALEGAIALLPDDVYALSLLSRVYALRYLKASNLDPRRGHFKAMAMEYLRRAQNTTSGDFNRVRRLAQWMQSKELS